MKKLLLISILFVSLPCLSAALPKGAAKDSRIQYITYDADNVTRIKTQLGTSTLIQLSAGETLDAPAAGLGIGDSDAWKLGVRGNNIFLKPSAMSPETNITLVTNKRTYALSLETTKDNERPAFIIRYVYPEEEAAKKAAKEAFPDLPPCSAGKKNENYVMWGDQSLSPYSVWDDGTFTCFRYPTNKDLPAIYKKMPDGTESLVNGLMKDDVYVVYEVNKEYRLRLGSFVLGIENTNSIIEGVDNAKNTTLLLRERKIK